MEFYIRHCRDGEISLLYNVECSAASCFAKIPSLADTSEGAPLPIEMLQNFKILVAVEGVPGISPTAFDQHQVSSHHTDLGAVSKVMEPGLENPAAQHDTTLMGFVALRTIDSSCFIAQISVAARYQMKGVGTALMAQAEDEIRSQGGRTISLTTYLTVPWNGPWYARIGFRGVHDEEVESKLGPEHVSMLQKSRSKHERPGWQWGLLVKQL